MEKINRFMDIFNIVCMKFFRGQIKFKVGFSILQIKHKLKMALILIIEKDISLIHFQILLKQIELRLLAIGGQYLNRGYIEMKYRHFHCINVLILH